METTMQTTTAPERAAQAAEYRVRMVRAADYVELVWCCQGTEREQTELAAFHADGTALARTVGEFGTLLLTRHLTAVPDEHADCEAGYVMTKLAAVTSRDLMRRCLTGDGAEAAWSAARFLVECMQEIDQVSQLLTDVRGNVATGRPPPEPRAAHPGGLHPAAWTVSGAHRVEWNGSGLEPSTGWSPLPWRPLRWEPRSIRCNPPDGLHSTDPPRGVETVNGDVRFTP